MPRSRQTTCGLSFICIIPFVRLLRVWGMWVVLHARVYQMSRYKLNKHFAPHGSRVVFRRPIIEIGGAGDVESEAYRQRLRVSEWVC